MSKNCLVLRLRATVQDDDLPLFDFLNEPWIPGTTPASTDKYTVPTNLFNFSGAAVTIALGSSNYTLPTLHKDSSIAAAVTYSSSNPNVATVDSSGNVTVNTSNAGTATITATVAETSLYALTAVSYTITVGALTDPDSIAWADFHVIPTTLSLAVGQTYPLITNPTDANGLSLTAIVVYNDTSYTPIFAIASGYTEYLGISGGPYTYTLTVKKYSLNPVPVTAILTDPQNGGNYVERTGGGNITDSCMITITQNSTPEPEPEPEPTDNDIRFTMNTVNAGGNKGLRLGPNGALKLEITDNNTFNSAASGTGIENGIFIDGSNGNRGGSITSNKIYEYTGSTYLNTYLAPILTSTTAASVGVKMSKASIGNLTTLNSSDLLSKVNISDLANKLYTINVAGYSGSVKELSDFGSRLEDTGYITGSRNNKLNANLNTLANYVKHLVSLDLLNDTVTGVFDNLGTDQIRYININKNSGTLNVTGTVEGFAQNVVNAFARIVDENSVYDFSKIRDATIRSGSYDITISGLSKTSVTLGLNAVTGDIKLKFTYNDGIVSCEVTNTSDVRIIENILLI